MKKILVLLLALTLLTGCGSKEKKDPNDKSVEVFDGLYATVDKITLKDSYGTLVANDNSAAFILTLTFENKGKKEQSIGSAYVQLFIDNTEYNGEMLGLDENAFKLHDTIQPNEKATGEIVFGVPAKISESSNVKIVVNDILYTKNKEIELDMTGIIKEITTATAKANPATKDGDMQSVEMEGYEVKVGNLEVLTSDDMKAKYPKMSSLSRGYNYILVDVIYTNNSKEPIEAAFNLTDNFDEWTNSKNAYARSLDGDNFNFDDAIAVGETREGKVLFVIKDDVTEVTIDTNPVRGTQSHMNFVFAISQ